MISKAHFHTRGRAHPEAQGAKRLQRIPAEKASRRVGTRRGAICFLAALIGALVLLLPFQASAQNKRGQPLDYIELLGFIDRPNADFLIKQIDKAEAAGSAALVVRIDSPGGLNVPVRDLVDKIRSADIPVIAWIGPSDAKGGSAAAFIASAAHVSAIAPRASFGPVLPANLASRGGSVQKDRALLKDLITFRPGSRKIQVYDPVAESRPLSGTTASRLGYADEAVSNLPALLNELDGRKIFLKQGQVVLPHQPFTLRFSKMELGPRLLHSALRPSIAYILLIIGVFGFIFELYHPGIGAAALSGALSLGFGLYAMTVLPTNWWAVLLLIMSLGLFLLELHRSSLGIYSLLGATSFFGATFTLFSGPGEVFGLKWWVVAQAVGIVLLFYFFIMPAAFRSQLTPAPDVKPLIGMAAVAETDISPMGKVTAGDSVWEARTFGAAIAEGAQVVVKGGSGNLLIVEEVREE